jgi:DNA-cytosine methyltransferase
MSKSLNVLSLFDGISCGMVALERAGININKYYASEIDKYAIKISQNNYPNIIHIGDVKDVEISKLDNIDLLIGGSPCQGFSFAGKQLNFEDHRSKLFFEYVRILNQIRFINPNIKFLLENVRMKKEYKDIISKELGVEPIEINSALVSAQNRKRLYWTNIENIIPPKDKELYLRDILEKNIDTKYFISEKHINSMIRCRNSKKLNLPNIDDKCGTIIASYYKTPQDAPYINETKKIGFLGNGGQGQRIYSSNFKSLTLSALGGGQGAKTGLYEINSKIRKLTPIECERLQTLPDNYTQGVSDSQRYKVLGNGWTVDIIAHILKNIN